MVGSMVIQSYPVRWRRMGATYLKVIATPPFAFGSDRYRRGSVQAGDTWRNAPRPAPLSHVDEWFAHSG
jgi:hypothetical protein